MSQRRELLLTVSKKREHVIPERTTHGGTRVSCQAVQEGGTLSNSLYYSSYSKEKANQSTGLGLAIRDEFSGLWSMGHLQVSGTRLWDGQGRGYSRPEGESLVREVVRAGLFCIRKVTPQEEQSGERWLQGKQDAEARRLRHLLGCPEQGVSGICMSAEVKASSLQKLETW